MKTSSILNLLAISCLFAGCNAQMPGLSSGGGASKGSSSSSASAPSAVPATTNTTNASSPLKINSNTLAPISSLSNCNEKVRDFSALSSPGWKLSEMANANDLLIQTKTRLERKVVNGAVVPVTFTDYQVTLLKQNKDGSNERFALLFRDPGEQPAASDCIKYNEYTQYLAYRTLLKTTLDSGDYSTLWMHFTMYSPDSDVYTKPILAAAFSASDEMYIIPVGPAYTCIENKNCMIVESLSISDF